MCRNDINVLRYNPLRVASVWMDDYKYLYYDRLTPVVPLAERLIEVKARNTVI
jgi:hypothetical protein